MARQGTWCRINDCERRGGGTLFMEFSAARDGVTQQQQHSLDDVIPCYPSHPTPLSAPCFPSHPPPSQTTRHYGIFWTNITLSVFTLRKRTRLYFEFVIFLDLRKPRKTLTSMRLRTNKSCHMKRATETIVFRKQHYVHCSFVMRTILLNWESFFVNDYTRSCLNVDRWTETIPITSVRLNTN